MLNITKCGHCGKSGTKIAEIEPQGAQYKQIAICCSFCNSILGTTGYFDAGKLVKDQQKEIASLHQQISQIDHNLRALMDAWNRKA